MKKFFNIKNCIIAFAIVILSLVSIAACKAVMPKADVVPSDYDLGVTFEQAQKEDKPILTVFYVDWCTYCKRFMPKMDKVRILNKNDINVVLINMEKPESEKLAKEYRISSYPTVYIIDPKYDNRVHIDNAFFDSITSLNKEVVRYINFRKLIDKKTCK